MDLNFNYFCSIIVQKKRKKNLLVNLECAKKNIPLNTKMDLYRFVVAFGFFCSSIGISKEEDCILILILGFQLS